MKRKRKKHSQETMKGSPSLEVKGFKKKKIKSDTFSQASGFFLFPMLVTIPMTSLSVWSDWSVLGQKHNDLSKAAKNTHSASCRENLPQGSWGF